jgi:NAD(P)-dependent dehydrogenase (short-subunit alcohol dehydrogenase family)
MPVSIVTGATGGIGRWVALGLARAGHVVVIVARDRQRGDATLDWITTHMASAQVELLIVDLSSLVATRHAGKLIAERYSTIQVLVNNAGVFCTRREETAEGHELVIAVNHLSPFLLARELVPSLRSAAEKGTSARIVNIGSSTSDHAGIDPFDLEGKRRWGMIRSYAQSKLALTMTTLSWARRLREVGVMANVVLPGTVATGLVRAAGPIGLAWRAMAPFLLTPEQGADTPLHVALSSEFSTITGAYIKKRQVVRPNRRVRNALLMEQVWLSTEMLAGR